LRNCGVKGSRFLKEAELLADRANLKAKIAKIDHVLDLDIEGKKQIYLEFKRYHAPSRNGRSKPAPLIIKARHHKSLSAK